MVTTRSTVIASTLLAASLSLGLQGCAMDMHHGTEVTEAQASAFIVGIATLDEVVTALGKPSFSAVRPNGEKVIGSLRSPSRINPPSLATLTSAAP